jgi:hypothetical protein
MIRILSRIFFAFLIVFLCGCSLLAPKVEKEVPVYPYYHHIVSYSGETLGIISKWYTGVHDNWRIIHKHNPRLRVHSIRLGQLIKIPRVMMIREEPLPAKTIPRKRQIVKALEVKSKAQEQTEMDRIALIEEAMEEFKKVDQLASVEPVRKENVEDSSSAEVIDEILDQNDYLEKYIKETTFQLGLN